MAYVRLEDYDRAIADFNEALQLNPSNDIALNNRGLAYTEKRDYAAALKDFDESIRINPTDAKVFRDCFKTGLACVR